MEMINSKYGEPKVVLSGQQITEVMTSERFVHRLRKVVLHAQKAEHVEGGFVVMLPSGSSRVEDTFFVPLEVTDLGSCEFGDPYYKGIDKGALPIIVFHYHPPSKGVVYRESDYLPSQKDLSVHASMNADTEPYGVLGQPLAL